ncbi:Malonyl-CoA decarboxylase, mitochondrial [Galdieria sulphuraria]|nr:Malonyl-CoA decarboxylase, mitochondrial [Galdieria sulphuraria]
MSTLGYFVRRLTTFKDRTFISKTWKRYLSEELGPKYYAEESSVTLTETPSELADRYLQSLLRRATAGNEDKTSKAPLWELPGDVVRPAPSSTHSSNSLDSDQQIVQQVRALFHDHKDVGLGSARPKFREMFTHRVAGEVAKQIRRLLLEPRFRLIETLATDLSPNVADMEKSVEYLKVQREQSPTTPETGENWKDSTGEDSLEANEEIEQPIEDVPASDRFLAVREQLTPPFYRVFKAMLDHPEGVMAVLQLRTVMGYRKELMDPFRVAVHRHLKYLSNRLVLDLFREDMLVLESSNIDSNARTIMFSYNDWRQEWNPRRTIFELLERLNKGCKVFNLKHKSQPLLTMATAHVAFCEQLPASDEEVGKLCEPYRSDRALHPVINHIRVRSLLGGLDMEQKVINHILYKDLPLRMNYNGDVYTLSVVRRFVSWLFHQMKLFNGSAAPSFQDRMVLSADDAAVVNTILEVLKDNTTDTAQVLDPAAVEDQLIRAKDTIMKLCAYYILRADGYVIRCSDPVARIHFSNGAELYRINYMADVSRSRLRESLGITVNFRVNLLLLVVSWDSGFL